MKFTLFLLCIVELLLVSFLRNIAGAFVSPLIVLLVSFSIGFVYLKICSSSKNENASASVSAEDMVKTSRILEIIAFTGCSLMIFFLLTKSWDTYSFTKDTADRSDVIPQIMYLVKRFRAGQQPYTPITAWGYSLFPTYLPFQWLPYVFAEILNIDYRWVPAAALWFASLYFFIRNFSLPYAGYKDLWKIVLPVWPLIIWGLCIKDDHLIFIFTVESLVAAYYLLVVTAIAGRQTTLLAIGISLCLLSRYSIILWVPFCLLAYLFSREYKKILTVSCIVATFFATFYWLPFLRFDRDIFLKGYRYHTIAAIELWKKPDNLANGLGFRSWALEFIPGDIADKLHTYQIVHIILCSLTLIICLINYKVNIRKYDLNNYLMFSLKLYLTVFYAFIQIPYSYLFIVPVMVSSALLVQASRQPESRLKQNHLGSSPNTVEMMLEASNVNR